MTRDLVYGRNPVREALRGPRDVLEVWAAVGVGEQVAAEGVTWDTASTFYRNEKLFTQPFVDVIASGVNIKNAAIPIAINGRCATSPTIASKLKLRSNTE